jgi:3-hydroxyacyl-[acyl-carrier-protein] dehydratase
MKIIIGIKYCGGCNPQVDRLKLVQEIKNLLPPEYAYSTDQSSPWDVGLLVCGCPAACADKPEFKNPARKWILVAGNSVDLISVPEGKIAECVLNKI